MRPDELDAANGVGGPQIGAGPVAYLGVDGAAAARFLTEVIDYLQSPGKLLLAER